MKFCFVVYCFALSIVVLTNPGIAFSQSGVPSDAMARITHDNTDYFGQPLGWDGKRVALLGLAGELNFIPASSRNDLKITSRKFLPFTPDQTRSFLEDEFSGRYDITTTNNFVVVHPWGDPKVYATPFEDFHRRFVGFFESNGVSLEPPKVPLIAIVLRSRNDFNRYLINEVEIHDSRIGGYYSRVSNRITTYDPAGQLRKSSDRWIYNASPILHEATHQSAFNTGVHNRFAPPPNWLSEGLATLFEAKGFSHSAKFTKRKDRINAVRLNQLRKHMNQGSINAALINLVANDRIFRKNTELAYALSWGLSFYLFENHRQKYLEFLTGDGKRKNFVTYTSNMRLKDFVVAFGSDFEKLETELARFFLNR